MYSVAHFQSIYVQPEITVKIEGAIRRKPHVYDNYLTTEQKEEQDTWFSNYYWIVHNTQIASLDLVLTVSACFDQMLKIGITGQLK